MKILFVNFRFSITGGSEQYFLMQIKKALEFGHTPYVICGEKNHLRIPGVKTFYIPEINKIAHTMRSFLKIRRIIKKIPPDCALVHNLDNPFLNYYIASSLPALKFLHSYDHACPVTSKFIGSEQKNCMFIRGIACYRYCLKFSFRNLYLNIKNYIEPFCFSSYKSLVVFSDFVMNQYKPLFHNMFFKLRYYCPLRKNISQSSDQNIILFIGRVIKEKGIYHLIDACADIKVPYTLIIAGDGPERETAQKYAAAKAVSCIWKGWISNQETAMLYETATVVAVPSIWPEPFGIIGLEAMNFSKPVVAFNSGGISEWLHHEKNGYLIENHSSKLFSEKLEYLLKNPDTAAALGKRGKKILARQFATSLFDEEFRKITDFLSSSS